MLSPAVLQAMQSSWADSSSANAADRLADQEAQIRHLEESNAMVAAERDQLLTTNRTMMGLLVEQIRGILSSSSGSGSSSGISSSSSTAAAVANISKRRRCLSLEVRDCGSESRWQSLSSTCMLQSVTSKPEAEGGSMRY